MCPKIGAHVLGGRYVLEGRPRRWMAALDGRRAGMSGRVGRGTRRDQQIRAVVRALNLIRVMNGRSSWSLQELHLATKLPKSTLSRLLATLVVEGYVRTEEPAGTYRLSSKIRELDAGYTERSRLVDAGRSIAVAVTKKIKWPLAIGTLDRDAIVVRFSSMPYSPLAVHTTTLGHRLGLIDSAMGRVYLAFCSGVERNALLDQLAGFAAGPARRSNRWLTSDLAQIRQAGFAVRQPTVARGSATLAVPILINDQAIAVLSMTTFGKSMTRTTIEAHVPVLQATAARIAAAFADTKE